MTNELQKSITAIVLAGGQSSRMGTDKALLTIGNQTLLARMYLVAAECSLLVYVVSPWSYKYRDILPLGCQLIEEKLVSPNLKSNSPIIGFSQGLRQVTTEWVLLLPCDLPLLSSSQIKQWIPYLATVLSTEIALLPRHPKGWEPLCGFYRRSCLPLLENYIDRGGRSFQDWLARHPVRELPVENERVLFNCNTPRDWRLVSDELMSDKNLSSEYLPSPEASNEVRNTDDDFFP
ncbi:molybdenum cofactor guanylyltransferase [Myxosarcina sp. GI1(2024)]